ncbi:unnamed protein product, partial [Rotaria sp. Silwood1]
MPLHATKFNISWLEKKDSDGTPVKRWLKQGTKPSPFICTLCKTDELCCGNKGWQSVESHMNNKKHRDTLKLIKENTTFTIQTEPNSTQSQPSSSSSNISTVTLASQAKTMSFSDQVTRAETLWAMNAARHGYILECPKPRRGNSYYKSILLGHAPANVIRDSIVDSFRTDGIDIYRLLMIGRDNPNVNKTVERLIDEELKKGGGELLKLCSCNIHVVHNAFKAGTTVSCWHIQDFCIDLWSWFRRSPARKEDFVKLGEELNEEVEKNILYFVCTRWVLLGKVVDRILSEETRKSLALLSKDKKETFFRDVRNIFQSIASYLKSNLPLNNSFLRDLKILGPSYRSDPQAIDAIVRIGRFIPGLLSSNEIDLLNDEWLMYSIETIDDSWLIKRKYNDLHGREHIEYHEIDYYWNKVFSIVRVNGHPKYSTLRKLVKNVLIVSHGNADVERGFSTNGNILTEERTLLSEKSINGLRAIYDGVEYLGDGSVHK